MIFNICSCRFMPNAFFTISIEIISKTFLLQHFVARDISHLKNAIIRTPCYRANMGKLWEFEIDLDFPEVVLKRGEVRINMFTLNIFGRCIIRHIQGYTLTVIMSTDSTLNNSPRSGLYKISPCE